MKRTVFGLGVILILLMPTPALAWFGWLDSMSGPGPFLGVLFEVRAVCFGSREPYRLLQKAQELKAIAELSGDSASAWTAAVDAWIAAEIAWTGAHQSSTLPTQKAQAVSVDALKSQIGTIETRLTELQRQARIAGGVGVMVTLCPDDVVRKSSIDFATDFWLAIDRDDQFGGGEKVRLSTMRMSYSFPLGRVKGKDILDYSFGIGAYWVTSRGFASSVRGLFLEPGRLYLHFPAEEINKATGLSKVLKRLVLSGAVVMYPGGFKADAFASPQDIAAGKHQAPIATEIRPTVAVFVNLQPGGRKPSP
jgi:hypothetical protein